MYRGIGTAGVVIFISAVLEMRNSWCAGVPQSEKTELVTTGIFRYSRNPAFLGFDLLYIGILLLFFRWWLFGFSVSAMLLLHLQIVNAEEPFLLSAFGNDYLAYQKQVCRYLGRKG